MYILSFDIHTYISLRNVRNGKEEQKKRSIIRRKQVIFTLFSITLDSKVIIFGA